MKRKLTGLLGIGLIPVLSWLLWPLGSEEFAIDFSEEKIAEKEAYLKEKVYLSDSINRPNIILILADDLGFYDISLNGNQWVNTKNIDALAAAGVVCPRAYVSSPICSPSRAGLLTGRHQDRFGLGNQIQQRYLKNRLEYYAMTNFVHSDPWQIKKMEAVPRTEDRKRQGIPPTEITLAEILKKYGYHTAITGKWHLGSTEFALPGNRGFDYQYGFYASHSLYAPEHSKGMVDLRNPKDWTDSYIWADQRNGPNAIFRNGRRIEEGGYLTRRIAEEANGFMEKVKEDPFFLFVPFNAPHTPLQVPEDYYHRFAHVGDPVKRVYYGMIAALDDAIGLIVQKVKSLGLDDNTLIFFLSDNGGASYTFTTDNAPLKGGKLTSFEGGLRVPFIVKYPAKLPQGHHYQYPVSSLDVFTTVCAAANIPLPAGRIYDGTDLLPYLSGEKDEAAHSAFFWRGGVVNTIIQDNWKLIFDSKWNQTLLYRIDRDPYERNNLAKSLPGKAGELQMRFMEWSRDLPQPLWPPMIEYKFEKNGSVYYFEI